MNARQRRKQRRWRRGKGAYVGPWWVPYAKDPTHGQQYNQPVLYGIEASTYKLWAASPIEIATMDAGEAIRRMFKRETGRDLT